MEKIITYFTSESVTEGHPDKVCDLIADKLLDEIISLQPKAHVAIEVCAFGNRIVIFGETNYKGQIQYENIARETLREIGYNDDNYRFSANNCIIHVHVHEQSKEIDNAVQDEFAGDQGMMFGYAIDDTPNYLPLPICYAHKLAKRLTEVRKSRDIPYLLPDGKTQVTIEYENGKPKKFSHVLISAQHKEGVDLELLRSDIIAKVIKYVLPEDLLVEECIHVNPAGSFIIGGPEGDSGLTGRKIIVDSYGGYIRHGGGSFSGKDGSKVDRSGAYMARYIAKNLVGAGVCKEIEVGVSYVIGGVKPISMMINAIDSKFSNEEITRLINKVFDLTPGVIKKTLELTSPLFAKTTNYGHFGKSDLPWEKLDRISEIKRLISKHSF